MAVDDCGAAYGDPAPLRAVYAARGIPLLTPVAAFGPPDQLRKILREG